MKKIVLVFLISFLTSLSYAQGLAMSSGILDYSDGQQRTGFVEATYTFKIMIMKVSLVNLPLLLVQ